MDMQPIIDQRRRPFTIELGYGLAATAITLLLLHHGWSAFDDGFYAWGAQRLLDGAVLHRDISIGHPGYANYVHTGLFFFFGEQLSVLRFPLPLLAGILVGSVARMARSSGPLAQGVAAFSATSLGVVQWITPSAGWFATALAAAAVLATCHASNAQGKRRTRLLLASGVLLGLCAGFRQYNGALLAAGLVVLQVLLPSTQPKSAPEPAAWQQATSLFSLLVAACLIGLPAALSPSIASLLLSLPAILCGAYALQKWAGNASTRDTGWMLPIASGCVIGFLPILIIAAANGALPEFFENTIISARGYAGYSALRDTSFTILLTDALQLLMHGSLYTWLGGVYLLAIALLPLALAILMYLRRNEMSEPFVAGITVLAAISLLINITLQNLLYTYYWLPAVSAAVIVLISMPATRASRSAIALTAALSAFALIFHAGRIPGSNWGDILYKPFWRQVACALPNCDLYVAPQLRTEIAADYRDITNNIPATRPLLLLPDGASLYPLLPHPSPWRLASVIEGLTPDQEVDRLAWQVRHTKGTAILVSRRYLSNPGPTSRLDMLIGSLCLTRRTSQFNIYATCPANPTPAGRRQPHEILGNPSGNVLPAPLVHRVVTHRTKQPK